MTTSTCCLRILVVDDNVDGADSLAELLGITGHVCQTAHSGPDALAVAREFRPDVVLLDIGLPGLSGYEVARELRKDSEYRNLTLVAVTGWGSDEDRRQTRDAGFDYHLTKPVELAEVQRLLQARSASREAPRTSS